MKKIIYTLLAVTLVFSACKKEEEEIVTPVAPSIVGTWTPIFLRICASSIFRQY